MYKVLVFVFMLVSLFSYSQTDSLKNEINSLKIKQLVSLEPNSNQQVLIQPQIKDVLLCGARVTNHTEPHSLFFTLDFAELEDGSWIVLEAGDGQVSGLAAGQNELKFYGNLLKIINQDENKDGVRQ